MIQTQSMNIFYMFMQSKDIVRQLEDWNKDIGKTEYVLQYLIGALFGPGDRRQRFMRVHMHMYLIHISKESEGIVSVLAMECLWGLCVGSNDRMETGNSRMNLIEQRIVETVNRALVLERNEMEMYAACMCLVYLSDEDGERGKERRLEIARRCNFKLLINGMKKYKSLMGVISKFIGQMSQDEMTDINRGEEHFQMIMKHMCEGLERCKSEQFVRGCCVLFKSGKKIGGKCGEERRECVIMYGGVGEVLKCGMEGICVGDCLECIGSVIEEDGGVSEKGVEIVEFVVSKGKEFIVSVCRESEYLEYGLNVLRVVCSGLNKERRWKMLCESGLLEAFRSQLSNLEYDNGCVESMIDICGEVRGWEERDEEFLDKFVESGICEMIVYIMGKSCKERTVVECGRIVYEMCCGTSGKRCESLGKYEEMHSIGKVQERWKDNEDICGIIEKLVGKLQCYCKFGGNEERNVSIGGKLDELCEMGRGSYGRVLKVFDGKSGCVYIVKEIEGVRAGNEEAWMGCEREWQKMVENRHNHVSRHLGYRWIGGNVCHIILEYVNGVWLSELIDGGLNEDIVRRYGRDILEGLKHLHGCGIIHRNLKCGNVMIESDGRGVLSDFGLGVYADQLEDGLKGTGFSSTAWMAPEVFDGRYGYSADIWSFGCMLIEMVSGEIPDWGYNGNGFGLVGHIKSSRSFVKRPESMSKELHEVLDGCLARDAEKRPSAKELGDFAFFKKFD